MATATSEIAKPVHDVTVSALLESTFDEHAARVALEDTTTQLTFAELQAATARIGAAVEVRSGLSQAPVAVLCDRSLSSLVAVVSLLRSGRSYLPLDGDGPTERLTTMVAGAGAELVLTARPIDWHPHLLIGDCADHEGNASPTSPVRPESDAYVIFTSGSTGQPKGIAVTNGNLASLARSLGNVLRPVLGDARRRFALNAPLSFDASVQALCRLAIGDTVVLVDNDARRDPRAFVELLQNRRIDVFDCTPSHLRPLLDAGLVAVDRSLVGIVGGEAIDRELWAQLTAAAEQGKIFFNAYGPTECTVDATFGRIGGPPQPHLGESLPGVSVRVLLEDGSPAPSGVPAEICVGGVGVSRGYVNQPAATARTFVPDPFFANGARLYRTGDIGRLRNDGLLEYLGRLDQQVKVRGFRVELREIEEALRSDDSVRDAAVVARKDKAGTVRLDAYVVAAEDDLDTTMLRDTLKPRLPAYMLPSSLVVIDKLPVTASGKLNRAALAAVSREPPPILDAERPRPGAEAIVAAAFADVLEISNIGRLDNFFELGGHSLLATRIILRLHEAASVDIPLRTFFDSPTAAALAQYIEDADPSSIGPPLVARGSADPAPLSFAQEGMLLADQLAYDRRQYMVPLAYRLRGAVQLDALQQAIRSVVARHEVLRSIVVEVTNGGYAAAVTDHVPPLPVVDLAHLTEPLKQRRLTGAVTSAVEQPFDLFDDPPLRIQLFKLAQREYMLLLTFHHIAIDAWSTAVFVSDLCAAYGAAARSEELTALRIQYADYAIWQRRWLSGERLSSQLEFWTQKLAGAPRLIELAGQHSRPERRAAEGAELSFQIPAALADQVRRAAVASRTSPFMLLLAVYAIVVRAHASESDLVIASALANRPRRELEPLIGVFMNLVLLRIDPDEFGTFTDLLMGTRSTVLEAQAHQAAPFDLLVDELDLERSLDHSPLAQIGFAYLDNTDQRMTAAGIAIEAIHLPARTVKLDLVLTASDAGDVFDVHIEYATALFAESFIRDLGEAYVRTLTTAVGDENVEVTRLVECVREPGRATASG